ncbi:putative F-box protein [Senna tora]|uniref:Putative F-box protein n=1 Tax=Senna tora TaxID=362788 RepID=A0A834X3T0_9FABA|nr:putative F-box protein [Senna tora]
MGGSRLMKRVARHRTSIECLPKDLLVDIFAKVASHSSTDLFNLKFCSKTFLDASQDNYIYQQVSLQKFPFIHWLPITHHQSSFLDRCKECGNLESLFRQGMLQFFSHIQFDQAQGFLTLQKAAREGHEEAMYVVALILLCGLEEDGLERQRKLSQALQYLRFLRMSKCVVRCRTRFQSCLREMWLHNGVIVGGNKFLCDSTTCEKGWRIKRGRWELLDDEDDENDVNMCEYCRWDYELKFFYGRLNVH